jgi:hypothetical protein
VQLQAFGYDFVWQLGGFDLDFTRVAIVVGVAPNARCKYLIAHDVNPIIRARNELLELRGTVADVLQSFDGAFGKLSDDAATTANRFVD